MGIFLTAIPVRRRRSQPLPFLREAENCNSLRQGLRNGILKVQNPGGKNRKDLILTGADPDPAIFGMISQRLNNPG
ncbi:hypothetical protein U3516DRAFT_769031 [Neocallimastix sp. 'constans']